MLNKPATRIFHIGFVKLVDWKALKLRRTITFLSLKNYRNILINFWVESFNIPPAPKGEVFISNTRDVIIKLKVAEAGKVLRCPVQMVNGEWWVDSRFLRLIRDLTSPKNFADCRLPIADY